MSQQEIRLVEEAKQDLHAGKQFYDHLQEGVGVWFWDSVLSDIESLQIYAGVHAKEYGYYRMLAKRFPYAVYYDLDSRYITVVAILPLRRDPVWIETQFRRR